MYTYFAAWNNHISKWMTSFHMSCFTSSICIYDQTKLVRLSISFQFYVSPDNCFCFMSLYYCLIWTKKQIRTKFSCLKKFSMLSLYSYERIPKKREEVMQFRCPLFSMSFCPKEENLPKFIWIGMWHHPLVMSTKMLSKVNVFSRGKESYESTFDFYIIMRITYVITLFTLIRYLILL